MFNKVAEILTSTYQYIPILVGKAAAAHAAELAEVASERLKWEDPEKIAAVSVGDEARNKPLSLSHETPC